MPRRADIESVLVLGAGPIVIGQACEFDYSGVQACKALREEGLRVVLANSNPATVMTDPDLAHATYIEPLDAETVARVIERERPDALLATMGGQTALDIAMALADDGTLDAAGVELIGARREAIARAEDRALFQATMAEIGVPTPAARAVGSLEEGEAALEEVGLPAVLRPSFTLGGRGGGVAWTRGEFAPALAAALAASPVSQVLVERSVHGWKEFELEVVRDREDNCIVVCSIENIDPMGIHTGDSVAVAPAITLTDREFQRLRDWSFACLRAVGVETGGSNVQFAVDPASGEALAIEMNPRVSRSSALASKATGFPIARVAARLALGYSLDELENEVSGRVPASFEPALDWVVVKAPRFDFEKFEETEPLLTTSMRSVGEAMAVGGRFEEAVQKAFASLETGALGLEPPPGSPPAPDSPRAAAAALARPAPMRLPAAAAALRAGASEAEVSGASGIDPWFVARLAEIARAERALEERGAAPLDAAETRGFKRLGFTDARVGALRGIGERAARAERLRLGARPVFRRIDSCAGEFPSRTPYLYSTWDDAPDARADEAEPTGARKALVLGGGPNRIGQGIEFDHCCVHAAAALREAGIESIMVNCNPETVSTDFGASDRLYFEPLTAEHVLEIARRESERGEVLGAVVQFGGQTPLRVARALEEEGLPILGTPPAAIDLAEDRGRFRAVVERLGLRQPASETARGRGEALEAARRIGFPVMLRPSYVLGGRAMRRVSSEAEMEEFIDSAMRVSGDAPVLIDSFLEGATEVDVDALADGERAWTAGAMEHVEEAGVHSGDSACAWPPDGVDPAALAEMRRQTSLLAGALGAVGLLNVQFAVAGGEPVVLEANPRASRTVPFLSKATGLPLARLATRLALGARLADLGLPEEAPARMRAVKEAVFPFDRFPGADASLGPEMRSTGEVMGIAGDFPSAFLKAQAAAGMRVPEGGGAFLSVREADREALLPTARALAELGHPLLATRGTAAFLAAAGLEVEAAPKVHEGGRPNVLDLMLSGAVALVINTPSGRRRAKRDGASIRRLAAEHRVPCFTTLRAAEALARGLRARRGGPLALAPLQDYLGGAGGPPAEGGRGGG